MESEYKSAYIRGTNFLKNNEFEKAMECFNYAASCANYEEAAIARVIQSKLKKRDLLHARELLEENKNLSNPEIKLLYGLLEESENNFYKSKSYYEECLKFPLMQNKAMLSLARINFQLGNYDICSKIYESLSLDDSCEIPSNYGLIILNYYLKNYSYVEKLINQIDQNRESKKTEKSIDRLINIMNNIKRNREPCLSSDNFFDKTVDHIISRHCNIEDPLESYFFKSIDISKLLTTVRDKIEPLNGNHYYISDLYKLRFDNPIGICYGKPTNCLCAATLIGEKGIITMYPITLSDQYDNEKLSTSKLLKLKRSEGIIKND